MWDGVIGQEQAVARLRRAAERPSHAYLLAGPRGSGVLEAARCFAAALVCPDGGGGACNACRRARSARHPDVIEVDPAGTFVVAASLDGSGGAAALGAEAIQAVLTDTLAGLERAQKQEAKALEVELTEAGYPDRLARRLRRDLEQRQQRAARRARTDALAEVVTALEWCYRDALVAAPASAGPEATAAVAALDACAQARQVIVARTAINEALLLEHLLVHLPPAANLEPPARVAQW